jgi:type IV pilus assembly protein PilF
MRIVGLLCALLMLSACVTETTGGIKPAAPNMAEASRTNTSLAFEYLRNGNLDLALEKARRALSQDDYYAPAHSAMALIQVKRGEDAEARKHFRRAMSLDARDPYTRNNFAIFECERGRADEALGWFEMVAKDTNYNAPDGALVNAGICASRVGKLPAAESYFRRALQIRGDNPDALLQLAVLASRREEWLKVRAFVQRRDQVAKPTAESLRLAIRAERALGDFAAADRLGAQLAREFP